MRDAPALLELHDITKRFPGVVANDRVSLTIGEREIHALLGENGAGKSTLMNVLYGLYERDGGEIWVRGQPVDIRHPKDAIALGIGMVHQDFLLVPTFTVAENVVMGLQDEGGLLLDLESVARRLRELSQTYGLAIDPNARVSSLAVGEQQRVEILKLLYRNADLLILDEPTAVLTPQETDRLFDVCRSLKERGKSVILITHKLREVMAIADRVTVLRDGLHIATVQARDVDERLLCRMMIGRDLVLQIDKQPREPGPPLLQVEGVCVDDEGGATKVHGVTLEVREGEVLGIAGVDGNGQSELALGLMNLLRVSRGRVLLAGRDITNLSPAAHRAAGMAYIPPDRRSVGSVARLSISSNVVLGYHKRYTSMRGLLLNYRRVRELARQVVDSSFMRTTNLSREAAKLSGGTVQKLILGRELIHEPLLLIAEQPTRGLDIAATEYVRRQLLEQRDRGMAVLLISVELEEVLALSDRIAVISGGRIMGVVDADNPDVEAIGLMMAGHVDDGQKTHDPAIGYRRDASETSAD